MNIPFINVTKTFSGNNPNTVFLMCQGVLSQIDLTNLLPDRALPHMDRSHGYGLSFRTLTAKPTKTCSPISADNRKVKMKGKVVCPFNLLLSHHTAATAIERKP